MDPAAVEVNFPSSSQRSESTPAVNGVGQYNSFGGGDPFLNRLPPTVQKHFWTLVTLLVVLNAIWLLIIFCIAVAALRQTNDLEDDMRAIFRGETEILKKHTAEIEHLDLLAHPYSDCPHGSVDSIYHECLWVSNVTKTYSAAKEHCKSMYEGKIAFPRSASEFSVLSALAVSSGGSATEPLKTFLGIMYNGTSWEIENLEEEYEPVTEEASKNFWELGYPNRGDPTPNKNCGVLERGPGAFNKMVSSDCDQQAYYICAIKHDDDHHHDD